MSGRKEFRDLIPPERARALIADLPIDPGDERVPLETARGRVTAERVDATVDVPGFDRASMDGYAVQASDTFGANERDPATLAVVGEVHAGETPGVTVEPGTAVEISTGAVLPPGADAVVMVERTAEIEGDAVEVMTAVAPGDHAMAAGADIGAGTRAIGPGRRLTARDLALLAALGADEVTVRGRPEVGVISTGDELVPPGAPLDHDAGEIYDVNGRALAAGIEDAGGIPIAYDPVPDDVDALRDALERAAAECDLVLSSGSTSASAVDVIYDVIADRGELLAHGVAVKPGKPMIIGRLDEGTAYVGLPGYPVSAQMVFRRFVAPRIREAAGLPPASTATLDARMASEARFDEGRMRLLPVGVLDRDEGLIAYPVDKGSGATTSLADADGVVEVAPDTAFVGRDEPVTVHLFDADVRVPTVLGVGEPDLAVHRLLDRVPTPRFLPVGTAEGTRRFELGVPDVLVRVADEQESVEAAGTLATWVREWGLVVPAGNPADVSGVQSLVDLDVSFANASANGLSAAIDAETAARAAEADVSPDEYRSSIDGYGLGRPGLESSARRVERGDVDVGVGLAATADRLSLEFVPVGEQRVALDYRSDREGTAGVTALAEAVEGRLAELVEELPGYRPAE